MHGFLLIDKPDGMTSHDVVNRVRRLTGEKRVGHAGTLDPFATGLLVVGVGRVATREFPKLVGLDKEYEATFMLGGTSDTDDRTGNIQSHFSGVERDGTKVPVNKDAIEAEIKNLTGHIEQIPPAYSAIKVGGKKMYELARAGKEVERKPRPVTIYAFELTGGPQVRRAAGSEGKQSVDVRIRCSTGTYIRSLARDLGAALGTGGYVEELRRTAVGPFRVEEASILSNLSDPSFLSDHLLPVDAVLSRLSASATVQT